MPQPYRKSLFDRLGPDAGAIVKVAALSPPIFLLSFLLSARLLGSVDIGGVRIGWLAAALVALLATAAVCTLLLKLSAMAGSGFKAFIQPSGSSTPYAQQYSYQEALAARGDVAQALASYESLVAADPLAVEPRIRAAELYAGKGANPARAAELFREVQRIPGVPTAREIYASNRLVDLYRGPLGDEGRALVELRRLADRHPGTRDAEHAKAAIARMKKR